MAITLLYLGEWTWLVVSLNAPLAKSKHLFLPPPSMVQVILLKGIFKSRLRGQPTKLRASMVVVRWGWCCEVRKWEWFWICSPYITQRETEKGAVRRAPEITDTATQRCVVQWNVVLRTQLGLGGWKKCKSYSIWPINTHSLIIQKRGWGQQNAHGKIFLWHSCALVPHSGRDLSSPKGSRKLEEAEKWCSIIGSGQYL